MKKKQKTSDLSHLAIILDGNRRWAKKRGLPTLIGHKKGYENVKNIADTCIEKGIKILTVFAFSTENWNRKKTEVTYLMNLLRNALLKDLDELHEKGIRIKLVGQRQRLDKDLQKRIKNAENKTKSNNKLLLQLAISYGGRAEITQAIKSIIKEKVPVAKITEELISSYMWTAGAQDPDMIIRTSGEQRTSGFLTWQSVYSELYFTKIPWPAFNKKELEKAINAYKQQQRRYGK